VKDLGYGDGGVHPTALPPVRARHRPTASAGSETTRAANRSASSGPWPRNGGYLPAWITARISASRESAEWTWWGIVES
jgi:hypothetical protein